MTTTAKLKVKTKVKTKAKTKANKKANKMAKIKGIKITKKKTKTTPKEKTKPNEERNTQPRSIFPSISIARLVDSISAETSWLTANEISSLRRPFTLERRQV